MKRSEQPWWARFELSDGGYQVDANVRFAETSGRGVVLLWTIDEDDDTLAVYLTPRELKSVLKQCDAGGGLLESVRPNLSYVDALLVRKGHGGDEFQIPRGGTEEEFITSLFEALDEVPERVMHRHATVSVRTVERIEHTLTQRPVMSF